MTSPDLNPVEHLWSVVEWKTHIMDVQAVKSLRNLSAPCCCTERSSEKHLSPPLLCITFLVAIEIQHKLIWFWTTLLGNCILTIMHVFNPLNYHLIGKFLKHNLLTNVLCQVWTFLFSCNVDILSWTLGFKQCSVFSSFLREAENWEVKTEAWECRASHCALVRTKRVASLDSG